MLQDIYWSLYLNNVTDCINQWKSSNERSVRNIVIIIKRYDSVYAHNIAQRSF